MYKKINYIGVIKALENIQITELLGKIHVDSFENMDADELLYIFPLIERIIIEIYKLIPGSIVEINTQGTMKTITSIIRCNEDINVFVIPQDVKETILKYYDGDDSLRNLLFHAHEEIIEVEYCKNDIIWLVAKLLELLNIHIKQYDISSLKKIEKI